MARERDEDSGRFKTSYPLETFLDVFTEDQFFSTAEVAEKVGCTQNLAYRRLRELEESGEVRSKMIGPSLAWQKID